MEKNLRISIYILFAALFGLVILWAFASGILSGGEVAGNDFSVIRQGEAAESGAVRTTRSITIGADGVSGNISPIGAVTEADRLAMQIIYEPLLTVGADGLLGGRLVSSFDISEDGRIYTLHIKDNVRFSDGSILSPYDVENSFLDICVHGAESAFIPYLSRIHGWNEFRQGLSRRIEGIEVDAQSSTVTFRFIENDRMNERVFLAPIFKDGYGTGPFVFDGVERGQAILSANPDYHGGKPGLEQVVIRSANVTSAPILMKEGNIDLFWSDYNQGLLDQMLTLENVSIGTYDGVRLGYIGFNQQNSLFQNPNILRALSLGTDVQEINSTHYGEFAAAADASIVPVYLWLHSKAQKRISEVEPGLARVIFESEGFSLSESGVYERGEERLSFVINTINSYHAMELCQAVADGWREIGVHVDVQTVSFANLREIIHRGDFDMLYLNMNVPHDMDFGVISGDNVQLNPFRWQDEHAAQLAEWINTADNNAAKEAFYKWLENYEESFVHLHIDRPKQLVFFNPNLTGLSPYNFGSFTWNIEEWSME